MSDHSNQGESRGAVGCATASAAFDLRREANVNVGLLTRFSIAETSSCIGPTIRLPKISTSRQALSYISSLPFVVAKHSDSSAPELHDGVVLIGRSPSIRVCVELQYIARTLLDMIQSAMTFLNPSITLTFCSSQRPYICVMDHLPQSQPPVIAI